MKNINDLPLELIIAILKRLDRENRLKCKRVSKFWLYILMNFSEFDSDRNVYFTNCMYTLHRPPISTFMNSTYKYQCKIMNINEKNMFIDGNIPDTFWSEHVQVERFGFSNNCYYTITNSDVLNLLEVFKQVKTFYFETNDAMYKFLYLNVEFQQIESIYIKSNNNDNYFNDNFKHVFPNLKFIHFERFNYNEKILKSLEKYTVQIDEIETDYCDSNVDISNINYKTKCQCIINQFIDPQPQYKQKGCIVKLYANDLFSWNSLADVKYLHLAPQSRCVFRHKEPPQHLSGVTELYITVRMNLCKECLETLFQNLTNVKFIHVFAEFNVDLMPLLHFSSKYCKRLTHLTLQDGYLETFMYKFDNLKVLRIKFNKHYYVNQLKDLHIQCPNLIVVDIKNSFEINQSYKLENLYSDVLVHNMHMVNLSLTIRSDDMHIITDKLIDVITKHGSKLRVSIFLLLIFFIIIFILYFFLYFL